MEHLPTKLGTNPRWGSSKTCGYWYLVTTDATSHTAFATLDGLMNWLNDRGLVLEGTLPERGTHAVLRIAGSYRTTSHLSYDDFYRLEGGRIRHLDNGDYTLGVVTEDEDGVRNVHYLNCNLLDRPVFDYLASQQQLN